MKTPLFLLISLGFYLSGLLNEIEMPQIKEGNSNRANIEGLHNLLSSDYQKLTDFSHTLKENGITEEYFAQLFWKGAAESHEFYRSSIHHQSSVNQLIEKELVTHVDLGHPIMKPEITKTNTTIAFTALNQFSGEWYGHWERMKVNHLWLPVQNCISDHIDGFSILGFQSCFTGDGFGWNYIVKQKNRILVLGFVYHFDATGTISARNPHYAFVNSKNQLTWVSDNYIYYEFVCKDSKCGDKKHYVITGGQYEKRRKITNFTSGFQAVYVPDNQELPVFKPLYIDGLKRAKSELFYTGETFLKEYFISPFLAKLF